jgi:hypothetical protein
MLGVIIFELMLIVVMLSALLFIIVMPSIIVLSDDRLNIVILSVIMLNVAAPHTFLLYEQICFDKVGHLLHCLSVNKASGGWSPKIFIHNLR